MDTKVSEKPLSLLEECWAVVPERFQIYAGAVADVRTVGDQGAQGVVCGISSVLPQPFRAAAAGERGIRPCCMLTWTSPSSRSPNGTPGPTPSSRRLCRYSAEPESRPSANTSEDPRCAADCVREWSIVKGSRARKPGR